MFGILISVILKINFKLIPTKKDIAGTLLFPIDCKIPFKVCAIIANIIEILFNCNKLAPWLAFGNNIFKIKLENKIKQIVDPTPIITLIFKYFIIISSVYFFFPNAFNFDILGIIAVIKGTFKDNGSKQIVSILPLRIPY